MSEMDLFWLLLIAFMGGMAIGVAMCAERWSR